MPLSQIVSASIQDGSVAPVDLTSDAQFYNYKNKIINGSFQVWQRATTYALTGTFAYGCADRWAFAMAATVAGTASQVASGLTGFQYALKLGRNAASTSTGYIYANQVVENANTYDLQGQTITVSFYAKAGANYSAAGSTIGLTVNTGAGSTDSSSLSATFGSWTGNATPYAGAITISTTWTRYSVTCTLGSAITNIGILFSILPSGTAGADDNVYITGVQLEKGVTATSFDYRPYGTELQLCQRYYEIVTADSSLYAVVSSMYNSTTNCWYAWQFKTSKRASATIALASGAAWNTNTPIIYGGADAARFSAAGLFTASGAANGSTVLTASAEL